MIRLVLLRHGQTTWNRDNRFTGWTDVPLTKHGVEEAKKAGIKLKEDRFAFDVVFTSVLKRAIDTTNIVLAEMELKNIPVHKSWRLNESHYGALQGLNKSEMAKKYGEEQVLKWRRSYDIKPPALDKKDKRWPGNDSKYKSIEKKLFIDIFVFRIISRPSFIAFVQRRRPYIIASSPFKHLFFAIFCCHF